MFEIPLEIIESAPIGIFHRKVTGEYLYVNMALAKIFRCNTTAELLEKYNTIDSRWKIKENHKFFIEGMKNKGHISNYEVETELEDGTKIWTLLSAKYDYNDDTIFGFTFDITKEKQNEIELKSNEQKLFKVLDFLPLPISFSENENIVFQNKAFNETFGYTLEDIPTISDWFKKAYPDFKYREKTVSSWNEDVLTGLINSTNTPHREYEITTKLGEIKTVEISGKKIENLYIAAFRDNTERKIHLDELYNYQNHLSELVEKRTAEIQELYQSLQKNENNTRLVLDTFIDDIYIASTDFKLLFLNKKLENEIGLIDPNIPCYKAVYGENNVCTWCGFKDLQNNENITFDIYAAQKKRYLTIKDIKISENSKLSIGYDNSKRIKIEEELRKLVRVVEQSPTSIIITNKQGIIEFVNPTFSDTTGYTFDDVIGKTPSLFNSGYHKPELFKAMWQTILSGNVFKGELCNRKKNGDLYWESASVSPIKNEKGQITHFVGIKVDITQDKINEEKLRFQTEIEALIAELSVKYIKLPINEIDDEIELSMNKLVSSLKLYRLHFILFNQNKITTSHKGIITHSDYNENSNFQSIRNELESNEYIKLSNDMDNYSNILQEIEQLYQDISFHGNILPLKSQKELKGILIFEFDNSTPDYYLEYIHIYQLIAGLFGNLLSKRAHEKSLLLAQQEAERANKLKTEFMASLSHEIRTPLNAILGFSEIMQEMSNDNIIKKYTEGIINSGNTLITLINEILDIAKIEAGMVIMDPKKINIFKVIEDIKNVFLSNMEQNSILFKSINLSSHEIYIVDEVRLRQILFNLIGNAVKFTKNGDVTVIVNYNNKSLSIQVKDTGIGINEADIKDIFEPFKQQPNQNPKYGGTGLGLTISSKLAKIMNGTISVTSRLKHGSIFSLELQNIVACESVENDTKIDYTKLLPRFDNQKILLVENDIANQDVIKGFLENSNIKLDTVENGVEALKAMESSDYDLILMDLLMPVMDGKECINHIRNDQKNKNIPIVVLTANVQSKEDSKLIKMTNGLLIKPIKKHNLMEILFHYFNIPTQINKIETVNQENIIDQYYTIAADKVLIQSLKQWWKNTETSRLSMNLNSFSNEVKQLAKMAATHKNNELEKIYMDINIDIETIDIIALKQKLIFLESIIYSNNNNQ